MHASCEMAAQDPHLQTWTAKTSPTPLNAHAVEIRRPDMASLWYWGDHRLFTPIQPVSLAKTIPSVPSNYSSAGPREGKCLPTGTFAQLQTD